MDAEGIRELVDENRRLQRQYDDLAERMIYEGNSISWTHSKAKNYGDALLDAWAALREIGVPNDGTETVAEAIRKYCSLRAALTPPPSGEM
jgi:hypothetical protein